MNEQLELFDIPFQIYSERQLYEKSCDFLEEPTLYTIFFVAAEQCNYLSEAKEFMQKTEQTLWIPGDDALRTLFPKKERHDLADFSILNYVMQVCGYGADMGWDLCFLMEDEKQLELVMSSVRNAYPYLAIHGLDLKAMKSSEMMVNEINSIAPEVLFLGLHSAELRRYIEFDRKRTNARLCICVGNLLTDEMSKKNKLFHTITMSRRLKKRLRKFNKKEQEKNGGVRK
ncbi:MAG: WecB/TagA/CpsF family glycosyltransferase [Bacteroides sp.]|nr:WecB/TagA/CpsF family glycosyltransferase [Bacteroides sp.]MCM1550111.1 WecB/TagA/CpsF family glycosyltransferase [Clostridium sp.]